MIKKARQKLVGCNVQAPLKERDHRRALRWRKRFWIGHLLKDVRVARLVKGAALKRWATGRQPEALNYRLVLIGGHV